MTPSTFPFAVNTFSMDFVFVCVAVCVCVRAIYIPFQLPREQNTQFIITHNKQISPNKKFK